MDKFLDPYEVLGVDRNATPDTIKAVYRKLALRHHPDKNVGVNAEEAAENFKKVATAYNILSDPDRRRRYDLGGFESLEEEDFGIEVDVSALGVVNTAFAAFFSKMGIPIRTAVPPNIIEDAYNGDFKSTTLCFGVPVTGKVEKQEAQFYEICLSQKQIDAGFVVAVHSSAGSRFKLLLFEQHGDGKWELALQEDSAKLRKHSVAAFYFLRFETYTFKLGQNPPETSDDHEMALFRRLKGFRQRDSIVVKPGRWLLAVYGDNWFTKAVYSVQAILPDSDAEAVTRLKCAEQRLLRKQRDMEAFELEYRRVQMQLNLSPLAWGVMETSDANNHHTNSLCAQIQEQFGQLLQRFEIERQEIDYLLLEREAAYQNLLQISATLPSARHEPPSSGMASPPVASKFKLLSCISSKLSKSQKPDKYKMDVAARQEDRSKNTIKAFRKAFTFKNWQ